jgi:hypothetical protein
MVAARSDWGKLLDTALPALDYVFGPPDQTRKPDWTLGGGTAIMLAINHRLSHDIDIFVAGISLKAFTPWMNPAARTISDRFQWPGHYLKFERPDGEIDFLSAPLQTDPGFAWQTLRGRPVALETPEEVIVKKVRYRSEQFKARDAFDLAAVGAALPGLAQILAAEVPDALPRLADAIRVLSARGEAPLRAAVMPLGAGVNMLPTVYAEASRIVARATELAK